MHGLFFFFHSVGIQYHVARRLKTKTYSNKNAGRSEEIEKTIALAQFQGHTEPYTKPHTGCIMVFYINIAFLVRVWFTQLSLSFLMQF